MEFQKFDLSKEFHGKDAMLAHGVKSKCVTLLIDGPDGADPWGREALYHNGDRVGRLTSGGYSVAFNKSIGMGYVPCKSESAAQVLASRYEIDVAGIKVGAEASLRPMYDPTSQRVKA